MIGSVTGEFNGKRVLVTGGTKGAGKAIADRFLQGEQLSSQRRGPHL
jgi:NAD(P)-dependent dehydrogenase (short-subunit alcohol dehydrogenase family)